MSFNLTNLMHHLRKASPFQHLHFPSRCVYVNAAAAEALLEKITTEIAKLAEFPNMGSVLSDEEYTLVNGGYRFIVIQPYLVFYRIIDHTIIIHRILHGRRDYLRELFST